MGALLALAYGLRIKKRTKMFKRLKRFFSRFRRTKTRPKPKPQPRLRYALDSRSRKHINSLDPKVRDVFVSLMQIAKATGKKYGGPKCDIKAISGHRTYEEQQKIYDQGRTTAGPVVSHAPPGWSFHNFKISIDLAVFLDGKYMDAVDYKFVEKLYRAIANIAEADGLRIEWGGRWLGRSRDICHFQYDTGLSMAEMRRRKKKGLAIV